MNRKQIRVTGLAILIGALLSGAVAAFAAVRSDGPDYDPGTRPAVAATPSASAGQQRAFPALARATQARDKMTDVEQQAFEIGQLYENGANAAAARFGADDGNGHRAALVPAKDDAVCVLGSSADGVASTCQTIADAALGRLFTADYPRAGGLRITGGLPGNAASISLIAPDGQATAAEVVGNTYLLVTARRDGGNLVWIDSAGKHSIVLPAVE